MAALMTVACNRGTEELPATGNDPAQTQILSHQIEPVKEVDLNLPALPKSDSTTVSEELDHIFYTDQVDRLNGTFIKDTSRDSARLARVQFLYSNGLIQHWEDKYKAAFVFIHSGGPFAAIDSDNYLIASQLFADVSKDAKDPQIVEESKKLAEAALNRYVHTKIFETMIHDPSLGKNGIPIINIEIEQS
jgi:hypothetical protein